VPPTPPAALPAGSDRDFDLRPLGVHVVHRHPELRRGLAAALARLPGVILEALSPEPPSASGPRSDVAVVGVGWGDDARALVAACRAAGAARVIGVFLHPAIGDSVRAAGADAAADLGLGWSELAAAVDHVRGCPEFLCDSRRLSPSL